MSFIAGFLFILAYSHRFMMMHIVWMKISNQILHFYLIWQFYICLHIFTSKKKCLLRHYHSKIGQVKSWRRECCVIWKFIVDFLKQLKAINFQSWNVTKMCIHPPNLHIKLQISKHFLFYSSYHFKTMIPYNLNKTFIISFIKTAKKK